ncbi:MAG: methionine--tRNA ligase [Candidatus Micrarchaeota archaeon]|nr:methionine--tRNA ligase [Candidatus Micrarchaeota archaeon]
MISVTKNKKILITSALPYVNNVPHLGNIIGCVLSADVFARYCRSREYDCLYICGTDEYGTATEIKALEEVVTPQQICDKYYKIHKDIYDWFNCSFDYFGRTSTPKHTEITQDIFTKLYKNGYVVEEETEQPYDEKAQMFLADRYIEGTCPYCKSEQARADQCDKCSKLLTYEELIDPRSKVTKTKPIIKKTKHLFIDLPGIEKELEKWIEKTAKEGFWSENSYHIAKAWLRDGLKKRAITRDLKWGVPVPLKGYENKKFYVWFEAPIGYISITANYKKDWEIWWKKPKDVSLYQFMGKDNVPFHTVIFPSTLLGTKDNWTMLHHINTTEFLNYEGGKFSKSRGVGVFGDGAVKSGVPSDVWRYYLLANRPEQADTNFVWQDFADRLNNELLANLGNLVNRTLIFLQNNFSGKVPEGKLIDSDNEFLNKQEEQITKITDLLEKVKLKDGLHEVMTFSKNTNKYFQDNKPWELVKKDKSRADAVLYVLVNQIKDLAILIEPYLPVTSENIFKQLNIEKKKWVDLGKFSVLVGHGIGEPKTLFQKLEQKQVEELKRNFSGKQDNEGQTNKQVSFVDLDIEVGEILSAEKHPNAEKLLVEKVKLHDKEIQLVSGIASHYKPEEIVGKKVLILRNISPAKLRGVESHGMLLVCESEDKSIEIISPDVAVGTKITLEGAKQKPKPLLTVDQFFSIDLEVNDFLCSSNGNQLFAGKHPLKTEKIKRGKIT